MHTTGKLTAEEFAEARRIIWAPHYWLSLFNHYFWKRFYWVMLGVFVGTLIVSALAHGSRRLFWAWGLSLGILCAVAFLSQMVRSQKPDVRLMEKLNADLPNTIQLQQSGVIVEESSGVVSQLPWSVFKGWRGGNLLFVLDMNKPGSLLIVPASQMADQELSSVRELLVRCIGMRAEPVTGFRA
jgi:hypothetical protein